jgi:hypothetical protein
VTPDFATRTSLKPPNGRKEAYAFAEFNPVQHIGRDGRMIPAWEMANVSRILLPQPLPYLDGAYVTRVAVHRKAAVTLIAALSAIHDSGLWDFLAPYGGGFQFRRIGGSPLLSMHSLALALDFDPANNARDLPADQSRFGASAGGREVVRLFGLYGWAWGGDFQKRPDAMHFQFATGV